MTQVKICCMSDRREVDLALANGADVLGFVGEQPSGPGRLEDDAIAELVAYLDGRAPAWLLTANTTAEGIARQVQRTRPDAVQICDAVDAGIYARLRGAFPKLQLIQVVHVAGPEALDEARSIAPLVDGLLLDSGVKSGPTRQLGGTGRTHDWSVSAEIVSAVRVPVWLAGGLRPGNVGAAIRQVRPHGVDLCSGVRDADYRLEAGLLEAFMAAVRGAEGPVTLPARASLADLQRYIHELEAQQGWLGADLVENGFLMVEEVGELHAAIRRMRRADARGDVDEATRLRDQAGEEIIDVLNYLLAIANRLGVDLEDVFRAKNSRNQQREWT